MGTTDPCALIRRGHAKLWPPTGLHTRPLSWPVHSVTPCSLQGPPPRYEAKGEPPAPALTPESTVAKRQRQLAQIPGGCSIQQITSCKLLLKTEIWAGLCKFRGIYYLLLPGARAHLRAGCSSAGEDSLETVAAAGIGQRLLFCFLSPDRRWLWAGGGLGIFFSCVSRSSGVRCDGAIQAPFPQALSGPSPFRGARGTRLRPCMGTKGAQVCGTRQRAVRQQGQVVGIKGSKAGGRCRCSDKSPKTEKGGRQMPRHRG